MSNRLDDGFSTIISFDGAPGIKLYEKETTPPGIEGGGPVDTTTMRNTAWRTRNPKQLKSLSESNFTAAYAVEAYEDLVDQVNVNQEITITFPDTSTMVFWGWIDVFKPNPNKEGEQPTAQVTIIPSNQDANGNEIAPVFNPAA